MEEKKYSVDEILAEAHSRAGAPRTAGDISRRANLQAEQILKELRASESDKQADHALDALLKELSARPAARAEKGEKPARAQRPLPEREPLKAQEPAKPVKVAPVEPPKGEKEIQIAPARSDVPQSPRKHKSIDEVVRAVTPSSENKIDKALSNQKEETTGESERKLTRTGVIRKANALIAEDVKKQVAAEPATTAPRMGALQKQEKIVGEKEDIQTKVYNEYIRRKEKKKQDTGMIKAVELKPAAEPEPSASESEAELAKTKVRRVFSAAVVDKETDAEKTFIGEKKERVISNIHHTGNIEGQTRLEGFFDDSEYEKITEDELEEQLEINRREKVSTFEMEKAFKEKNRDVIETVSQSTLENTYAPEKETPVINDVIDYNSKNDQRAIYLELENLLNRFKLRTIITFAAELVVAVIGIFGAGLLNDFGLGTGTERIYIIINTALLVLMMIVNMRAVFKGIKTMFLLKPSGDSLMALAAVVSLVHCALALTLGESGAGVSHIYVGATGFLFLLNCFGKRSMIRRTFKNFRFIIKKGEKYSAAEITDPKQAQEFAKGSNLEYIDIRYNAKTAFPTGFLANSYADDPSDIIAKLTTYPAIGLALIIGVITYFITKDWMSAASALCAALIISVPASSIMAFNKALENADAALLKERGTITGFAAVKDIAQTTSVVLTGEELFPESTCMLKGMKLFKKMQMDEAILYAASVLSETKHPLKGTFMESISEVQDHMPASFDTAYEAKLGLSTWIYDRKVLLGNKEMMGAHGIEIPSTAKPEEYNKGNRRAMFLAIDGSVYAMFVVEYFSDPIIEYELQRLEASNIELLVKTEDSNIDQSLICELFDLDSNSVKILSMVASNIYDEKMEKEVYNEAKLINRGDSITFMRAITACSILNGQFSLLKLLQYISIGLGVLIIAVLSFIGSISTIGPVHITIYAAFWMVVTNLIPRIYKAVPKR